MKHHIYFFQIFLLLATFGCGNQPSPAGKALDLTGFQITDLPNGFQQVERVGPDGGIIEEGTIKNGKRNGTWVTYQNGRPTPKTIANFVDDQYSGVYLEYTNSFQLELMCHYSANVLNGKFVKMRNTRVLEEGSYKDGQIDGKYLKYFEDKNGVVQQEINYKMGKLHGMSNYYNEEGKLMMEYEYKDGEKVRGGMVGEESGN